MLTFPNHYGLGYGQTIRKGDEGFKSPMLIVGANVYLRKLVKAEHLRHWDIHLLFFPSSEATWTVGILGTSLQTSENITSVYLEFIQDTNIENAIKECANGRMARENQSWIGLTDIQLRWLNNSIYRCPKISLKDILSLEEYKKAG